MGDRLADWIRLLILVNLLVLALFTIPEQHPERSIASPTQHAMPDHQVSVSNTQHLNQTATDL